MKVTVVTPTMGNSPWLRLCLRSVRDQIAGDPSRRLEVEHIVLNGAPAAACEVEATCAAGQGDVQSGYALRFIHEQDQGMYDAINKGFRQATGDVLAWLNGDEQYLPGTLARIAAFLEDNPSCDLCVGDTVLMDGALQPIGYRQAVIPDYRFIQAAYLNLHSSSMFLRRTWFEAGYELPVEWRTIGDAAWLVEMIRGGLKMGLVRGPLSCFVFTGGNLGQSQQARDEISTWHSRSGLNRWTRTGHVVRHLLKECLAGARFRRDIAVSVYPKDGPAERAVVQARKVSPRFRLSPQA